MPKRKKDHYPSSVLAIISLLCGLLCFVIFWVFKDGFDIIVYAYFFFFGVAVLLGGYSLVIQRSTRAWLAVIISSLFILLMLSVIYLLRGMCVVC